MEVRQPEQITSGCWPGMGLNRQTHKANNTTSLRMPSISAGIRVWRKTWPYLSKTRGEDQNSATGGTAESGGRCSRLWWWSCFGVCVLPVLLLVALLVRSFKIQTEYKKDNCVILIIWFAQGGRAPINTRRVSFANAH